MTEVKVQEFDLNNLANLCDKVNQVDPETILIPVGTSGIRMITQGIENKHLSDSGSEEIPQVCAKANLVLKTALIAPKGDKIVLILFEDK